MMIPLSSPCLDGNEAIYLQQCVNSNFVSSVGPFVDRFEREFAAFVGSRFAVACSSGTAALHVALLVAGARMGKLVAVSDFTFVASANAAVYTGADVLLVDSEPTTWNMDTERLHDEVIRRADHGLPVPDVIEIVHVLGHPAAIEPLLELRNRFGIPIVEDAAESLGAHYCKGRLTGRQVGTIGELGCYSFNGNKTITTGGGGMIVTDDESLAERARHLTTQARLKGLEYRHDQLGYNYRMTNVAAALGVAQLEQLPDFLERKRRIARRYRDEFTGLPLEPSPSADWAEPSFWLSSVLVGRALVRDGLVASLLGAGVEARPLWLPMHEQPHHRGHARLGGDVADDIHRRGLSLPSSCHLTDGQQDVVIDAVKVAVQATRT